MTATVTHSPEKHVFTSDPSLEGGLAHLPTGLTTHAHTPRMPGFTCTCRYLGVCINRKVTHLRLFIKESVDFVPVRWPVFASAPGRACFS